MITKQQAEAWLKNHPEDVGDGFYMAGAIIDLHTEIERLTATRVAAVVDGFDTLPGPSGSFRDTTHMHATLRVSLVHAAAFPLGETVYVVPGTPETPQ